MDFLKTLIFLKVYNRFDQFRRNPLGTLKIVISLPRMRDGETLILHEEVFKGIEVAVCSNETSYYTSPPLQMISLETFIDVGTTSFKEVCEAHERKGWEEVESEKDSDSKVD
jgi:hypothetical protein